MKIITRRDRSGPLFVLVLAVISALIGILPQHSFAVPSQFLQPEIQQYFETTNVNYAINTGASGAISGTASGSVTIPDAVRAIAEGFGFTIPAVLLSSGNNFNFSAPGITESLNLITSGPAVNYLYNVPYSLSFNMPTSVTAGQRVYLNPTVTWGNPLLQGSQSLEYMTSQSLSADAPGDGIAPLKVSLNQSPTRLNIEASVPLGPVSIDIPTLTLDSNSTPNTEPVDLSQFGTGKATFFGVTNNFGGTGSIDTSGGIKDYVGENNIAVSTAPGTLTDAWSSGGDQLVFMGAIPVVGPIALGLSTVFDLTHEFDVDIRRQDSAYFEMTSLPYFDVPNDSAGSVYTPTVHLDYKGTIVSYFDYLINTKVIVDGPGFGPITLLDIPLGSIDVGMASSQFTGASTFSLSIPVSVDAGSVSNLGLQYAELSTPYYEQFFHATPPGYSPVTPSDTNVSVPEPSTLLLVGSGLAGLAWMRRKLRVKS